MVCCGWKWKWKIGFRHRGRWWGWECGEEDSDVEGCDGGVAHAGVVDGVVAVEIAGVGEAARAGFVVAGVGCLLGGEDGEGGGEGGGHCCCVVVVVVVG